MGVAWQKLIVSVNLAQISGAQDRTNCREKEKKEMISDRGLDTWLSFPQAGLVRPLPF